VTAKLAIRGAELVDPEAGSVESATLLVEDGRLAGRLAPDAALGGDWRELSRPGCRVAPGFIDLHHHGELVAAAPEDFAAALDRDAERMVAEGCTAFLATSVCWPGDALMANVEALAEASASGSGSGAACLGLHLEGPWISPAAPGAMAPDAIAPFDARGADVLDGAGEVLRMVTLAPEVEGADALLAELTRRGVLAALGHSRAEAADIDRASERGLRHVTHLWNAMGPVHHREPGVAGHVLSREQLSCDLICDGHHVHPDTVRFTARALGERLVLITDRVEPGAGDSALGRARAGPDGAPWRRADGTLVGSQLGLADAVRNAGRFADLDLARAVAAATLRPARLLGVENQRGTLRDGARADLVLLDAQGRAVETWLGGRPVWGDLADGA